jgi:hypothetical protein
MVHSGLEYRELHGIASLWSGKLWLRFGSVKRSTVKQEPNAGYGLSLCG